MDQSAALLNAMANSKRLAILTILTQTEMPVGELADAVNLSQSALSQHLAKLRASHLVSTRRESQTIFYSSHSEAVKAVLRVLDTVFAETPAIAAKEMGKIA